jgi:hypothetical protein
MIKIETIDKGAVEQEWSKMEPLVQSAIEKASAPDTAEDIRLRIQSGEFGAFWIEDESLLIFNVAQYPTTTALEIYLYAGELPEDKEKLWQFIKYAAKTLQCDSIMVYGRDWSRVIASVDPEAEIVKTTRTKVTFK